MAAQRQASASDGISSSLQETLEARLTADEERLGTDEARIAAGEARLDADEARIAEDEKALRSSRLLAMIAVVLGGTLVIAIAGLTISLFALNRDIETVARAAPKDDSVGTAAIKHAAVTADKLAAASVTAAAVADGAITRVHVSRSAIGSAQIARRAVTRTDVRPNALTGAQIDERTLGRVPSAVSAAAARQADDARLLAGLGPSAFLSRLHVVRAASFTSVRRVKGPIAATCPTGMRIVSGGAAVDGTSHGVALVRNAPGSGREWVAAAAAISRPVAPWRLVVTAICVAGGR